jgi:hypothetical protein
MLSKRIAELPAGAGWIFEPKWDGFRALIFRDGDEILMQSRDGKSLNRYFPELLDTLRAQPLDLLVRNARNENGLLRKTCQVGAVHVSGNPLDLGLLSLGVYVIRKQCQHHAQEGFFICPSQSRM